MPLVALEELAPLLVCPSCRGPLDRALRCACGRAYEVTGKWPVLVDFERSVLAEDEVRARGGESPLRRGDGRTLKKKALELLFPPDPIAWKTTSAFREALRPRGRRARVLVIGGGAIGAGGTRALYDDPELDVIAFDIYGSHVVQFIADAHQIPLADGSVDGVVVQAVLEHVLDPWLVSDEIHRVLAEDGVVYAETPFLQQVHEGAYDFTRFTESGHRWLFKRFSRLDSGVLLGPGSQLLWSIDHATRSIVGRRRAGTVARTMFFWVRWLDRVARPAFALDGACAVYFLGRRADRALSPKEAVAHYRGAQTRDRR